MSKILVTGGCGYIGSHTIVDLIQHGYEVISIDNLINSFEDSLEGVYNITGKRIKNYTINLVDAEATAKVFAEHPDISGVIHFAALKAVDESVDKPLIYFRNNLDSMLSILECMRKYQVANLIFSSSCTVYGNPESYPVDESAEMQPAESPYGRTKQLCEYMLDDICKSFSDINVIKLRYFNPGGAHESAEIGERARYQVINLIPVINQTAIGKRDKMHVHGNDYDTRDGSCIRDYIHIVDLANAHTKSIQYLEANKQTNNCEVFNLGIGSGVTVLEAIKAFEAETGISLNYEIGPRRAGDIPAIYSNYEKAKNELGWTPRYDINDIMRTAWAWEQSMKEKFPK